MYSSHYLFLLIAPYFLFLRRSHYDYDSELIFSPEERVDFVASSNRVSRTAGAIAKAVPTRFPVHLRALSPSDGFHDAQIFRRRLMSAKAMTATIPLAAPSASSSVAPMLVGAADSSVETFDTTAIHAETAADFAMG
jgi:hypothetical protein